MARCLVTVLNDEARLLEETSKMIAGGSIKVMGYTPVRPGAANGLSGSFKVNEEAAQFSRTLKFLQVDETAALVIPSDSEVVASQASAAVFKKLADMREQSKDMEIGGAPADGAPESAGATTTVRFSSLSEYQKDHKPVLFLPLTGKPDLKLVVTEKGRSCHGPWTKSTGPA